MHKRPNTFYRLRICSALIRYVQQIAFRLPWISNIYVVVRTHMKCDLVYSYRENNSLWFVYKWNTFCVRPASKLILMIFLTAQRILTNTTFFDRLNYTDPYERRCNVLARYVIYDAHFLFTLHASVSWYASAIFAWRFLNCVFWLAIV